MSLNIHLRIALVLTGVALSHQECADGYYEKDSNCYKCADICVKCTGRDFCSECPVGSWGSICDKHCPDACLNNTCSVLSSACIYGCKPGYHYGIETCPCPSGCMNDVCDQDTGQCTDGCTRSPGYGTICPCPPGCQNNNCDRYTSVCLEGCKPGYISGTFQCPSCPFGCKDDVCDEDTGFCHAGCKKGFFGDICRWLCSSNCISCASGSMCYECKPESYGDWCELGCNYCLNGTCSKHTGACTNGCKRSNHGTRAECPCDEKCKDDECDRYTGECTSGCRDGYHGTEGCPCPEECENYNCDVVTGNCTAECKEGYQYVNNTCTLSCSANCESCELAVDNCIKCHVGFYGRSCNMTCPSNCLTDTCEKVSGQCSEGCKPGYFNTHCEDPCPGCIDGSCEQVSGKCKNGCMNGYHGTKQCPCSDNCKTDKCNTDTGHCSDGCEDGYYGDSCSLPCFANCQACTSAADNCTRCEDGYHGVSCELKCPSSCRNRVCHQETAVCTEGCNPGYYSTMCEERCSAGCIGDVCNETSGICLNGCRDGYHGTEKCPCPEYCKHDLCEASSGSCYYGCKDGYHGTTSCPCPDNCRDGQCDIDSGHCTGGCKDGYYGEDCSLKCLENCTYCTTDAGQCTQCNDGNHGSSCQLSCPKNCINRVCRKETGSCIYGCMNNYYGDHCDESCPIGCDKCVQYDECTTCKPRFYLEGNMCLGCPPQCKECSGPLSCSLCDGGFHGLSCQNVCPTSCLGRLCHQSNGVCLETCDEGQPCCPGHCKESQCSLDGVCSAGCLAGYYGDKCEEECDEHCESCTNSSTKCDQCVNGWHGTAGCQLSCSSACARTEGKLMCGITDGSCINGCRLKTKYGPHCTKDCSHNCVDRECDQATGRCSKGCESGYYGDTCKDACSPFCLHMTCHRDNGTCVDGCSPGFSGETCKTVQREEEAEEAVQDKPSVWLFAIGGVTVLLLVGFIVMVAVLCLRRRRPNSNRKGMQYGFELAVSAGSDEQSDAMRSGTEADSVHGYESIDSEMLQLRERLEQVRHQQAAAARAVEVSKLQKEIEERETKLRALQEQINVV